MENKAKLSEFIEKVFDMYSLSKYGFFVDYDCEKDEYIKKKLFSNGSFEDTIRRVSVELGLSKNEVLAMDEEAAGKYLNKFPFIEHYDHFTEITHFYEQYKGDIPSPEQYLRAIFGIKGETNCRERYDTRTLIPRLVDELKRIDTVAPGTYHKNAEITKLHISTEVFISYPSCTTLIRSFIEMVDRFGDLFMAAVKQELDENEINELNFLANWLDATDVVLGGFRINYDKICKYREIYLTEDYSDYLSYIRIKYFFNSSPWRCREFFDDMDLVYRFLKIFPHAKAEMRDFAMKAMNFSCYFIWSDAKPVLSPEDQESERIESLCMGDEDYEPALEHTEIYVPKKAEEMDDWEDCANKLILMASSEAKGGLKLPKRELDSITSEERTLRYRRRFYLMIGGSKQ